jgi:hypothetical protein
MKKYYIKRGEFANMYDVVYAETEAETAQAEAEGYERITRKEAEHLCRAEREREQYDAAFSGYASSEILPISYPADARDWRDDRHMALNGYIVERI